MQHFDTPALEPDKVYFYMVRIEMKCDGQPFSETRRIAPRGLVRPAPGFPVVALVNDSQQQKA
jgi:hypothetical protein